MSRMYTQYVGMREILDKVGQLVPAVQLETYQVYRYREHWERAVRCSARTGWSSSGAGWGPSWHERFGYGIPFSSF